MGELLFDISSLYPLSAMLRDPAERGTGPSTLMRDPFVDLRETKSSTPPSGKPLSLEKCLKKLNILKEESSRL